MPDRKEALVKIRISYEGGDTEEIVRILNGFVQSGASRGWFSGEADLEVVSWDHSVKISDDGQIS